MTEKSQERKDLDTLNTIRDELALAVSRTTILLFEDYKRSPEHEAHEKAGTTITAETMRKLAQNRARTDFLVAKISLMQEGSIPSRNVFFGRDELIRSAMLIEGDKEDMSLLNHGYAHLCIHDSVMVVEGKMLDQLESALDRLKEAIEGRAGQGG